MGTAFGTTLEVQVSDAFGDPVSGVSVTFAESTGASGAAGTFTGNTTVTTNSQGLAIAPPLDANDIAGNFTVSAALGSISTSFLLNNLNGAPANIASVGGTPQNAAEGSAYGTLLQAQVTDSDNNPVANVPVTFAVPGSGASGAFNALATVLTNALGIATAPTLTANQEPGNFTVTATAVGVAGHTNFSLTNLSTAPASINAVGGTPQNAPEGTAYGTLLQASVTDSNDNPVANVPVTFSIPAFGATGTFHALATVLTNALGIATAPALTANQEPGNFTVTATAAGVAGTADFALTNTAVPTVIKVEAGSGQLATVKTAFVNPLQVLVTSSNKPVSGITVDFEVPNSGASGTFALVGVVTNASGIATAPTLTANTVAGKWTVDAWVAGVATPAAFTLTNTAGTAKTISSFAGNNQSTTVVKAFATPLQTLVVDSFGNPVSGASVTFTISTTAGNAGGTFAGGKTTVVAITGANGVAKAPALTANTVSGSFSVNAAASGVANPVTFSLTNNPAPPHDPAGSSAQSTVVGQVYSQALQARVSDIYGNPIPGVTVTFTAPAQGPSGSFAGQRTATAITGTNGVAIAPPFTANTKAGHFALTVSTRGVPAGSIALTNLPGPAAAVQAVDGTKRTVSLDGTLRTLEVEVTDAFGNVIQGATVTFSVQTGGESNATALFAGGMTAVASITNDIGKATAPALKANDDRGSFIVTATVDGIDESVSFQVTIV